MTKTQNIAVVEQILDDEYGVNVDDYPNKSLKDIGAMINYLAKNREDVGEE